MDEALMENGYDCLDPRSSQANEVQSPRPYLTSQRANIAYSCERKENDYQLLRDSQNSYLCVKSVKYVFIV